MKSEKEIRELLNAWKMLKKELSSENDFVSREVSKCAECYIKTLEWVLEE